MSDATHARLTALFGEAIDATAGERAALIDRVRADDPALADELVALLAADDAPLMHTGALEPTMDLRPTGARRPFAVDGYRIVGVLGEGGMGTVYAAEQRAPRRPVAIKVLRSGSLARFAAEAEVMARLDHPGIAKVLEAGEAQGAPYFVMERVDGTTLDVYAAGLALPRRLALVAQACDAVHHAHVNGVIHRDLKPSNLMVRADGRLVILDFGIARVAGDEIETRAGELIGTPHYMSPEQARLRPDDLDARSDVYTLGVILYELVDGAPPYDLQRKSFPEVARIIGEEPPRPLHRVHGDLVAIAGKALAKSPDDRYHSAAALADDLRRHLAGDTIAARVPTTLEVLGRAARRRPGVAAAIGTALLATVALAIVVTSLWWQARTARRAIERERAAAVTARDLLEARGNQLVLDRARGAVARDPTEAWTLLAGLTPRGVDPVVAWAIADEALGRGVATEEHLAHTDEIRDIEPIDGGLLTAGYDGRALRFARGDATPHELWSGAGRVHVARASPDGASIVLGADRGALRVVDRDGAVRAELRGLTAEIDHARWSRDGRWLAAADEAGDVWLWPSAGGAGRRLDGGRRAIESFAIAVDGAAVIAGDDGGTLWRWTVEDATPPRSVALAGAVIAVWGHGDALAAIDRDGDLVRLRAEADRLAVVATRASGLAGKHAAIAPDGSYAIIAADDGTIARISDDAVEIIARTGVRTRAVAISDDGRRFAIGDDDGLVQVWDATGGRHLSLRGHRARVRTIAFTPDGRELLSADGRGVVRRWPIDATPPVALDGHRAAIVALATSSRGDALVSADDAGEVRRWDLLTGGSVRVADRAGHVTALAFAGPAVVVATDAGTLTWHAPDDTLVPARIVTTPGAITALAASADGAFVAAATSTGPIAVATATTVTLLSGHAGGTDALAIDPAGAWLASGGEDRAVRLWRLDDLTAPPRALGPTDDDVRVVERSPDGTHLLAGDDDGRVRSWDLPDPTGPGRVLATHAGRVLAIAVDAGTVVSIGRAGDVLRTPLSGARTTSSSAAALARFAADRLDPDRVTATVALAGDRIAIGLADGTILIRSATPRSLADLAALVARPR